MELNSYLHEKQLLKHPTKSCSIVMLKYFLLMQGIKFCIAVVTDARMVSITETAHLAVSLLRVLLDLIAKPWHCDYYGCFIVKLTVCET